jgi:hypothetical protein
MAKGNGISTKISLKKADLPLELLKPNQSKPTKINGHFIIQHCTGGLKKELCIMHKIIMGGLILLLPLFFFGCVSFDSHAKIKNYY